MPRPWSAWRCSIPVSRLRSPRWGQGALRCPAAIPRCRGRRPARLKVRLSTPSGASPCRFAPRWSRPRGRPPARRRAFGPWRECSGRTPPPPAPEPSHRARRGSRGESSAAWVPDRFPRSSPHSARPAAFCMSIPPAYLKCSRGFPQDTPPGPHCPAGHPAERRQRRCCPLRPPAAPRAPGRRSR